jgi:DNA-binding HxlR family transcriptional regulator
MMQPMSIHYQNTGSLPEDTSNLKVSSDPPCSRNLSAIDDVLYVVGGKWKLRIMVSVLSGHIRFNDLQRTVKGISARVLSSELKSLEQNGLVKRVAYSGQKPVVVEYIPTEYSQTLKDVIAPLVQWGANHKKKIMNGNS